MSKLLSLCAVAVLISSALLQNAAAATTVTFQSVGPGTNVTSGAAVSVPIRVSGFTSVDTFQFTLQWNTNALTYSSLGTTFGVAGLATGNFGTTTAASAGKLPVSWDDPDGANKTLSDGTTIFTVNFIGGTAGTNTTLSFVSSPTPKAVTVNLTEVTFGVNEGTVTIAPVSGNPPTISSINKQTTLEDTPTSAIAFTVGDIETAAGSLLVTASSADTSWVAVSGLVLGGSGASRTLTITPVANAFGTNTITVTVTDTGSPALSTSTNFTLEVGAVNDQPTITGLTNQTTLVGTPTSAQTFTVGDVETAAAGLVVTASSSNTTLVPNANIALGGSGASRTVSVTPASGQQGETTISAVVSDGSLTATSSFTVTVSAAPNTPPTITTIANQTTAEDTATGAIAFTVGDTETAAGSLVVTASSSDTSWVAVSGLVLGGSGASRTLTITPVANAFGTNTITVTVTDAGSLSTSTNFTLAVAAVPDAPTISSISNQTNLINTATSALPFTVGDVETAATNLVVTASSSNTTLVPNANIVLGGSGATRTVTVSPATGQTGTATISLVVSDGSLTATSSFTLRVVGIAGVTVTFQSVGPGTNVTSGASVSVPINVSGFTNVNTFQFTLQWSTNTLQYSGLSTTFGVAGLASGNFGTTGTTNAGKLTVSWDDPDGATKTLADGTTIFTVNFTAGAAGTTALSFTASPTAKEVVVNLAPATFNGSEGTVTVVTPPPNTPPTITTIANQTTAEDTATSPIAFTVGDTETAAGSLLVTASSSGTSWVAVSGLVLGGSGASRTLTITPVANAFGTNTITVTVTDAGSLATSTNFTLAVTSVNDLPTISPDPIPAQATSPGTAKVVNLTVADVETAAASLTLTNLSSSNTALVPNANIVAGGSGSSRTVTVTPAAGQTGSTTISLGVADADGGVTTKSFTVTVLPPYHSADYQTNYWIIDATEANRVLSYWRAGAYHIDAAGFDGYAPGTGATNGLRHSADYQTNYWVIDASEANRVLSYWRAGGYHPDASGFDGYAPGTNTVGLQSFIPARRLAASAVQSQHDTRATYQAGGVVEVNVELSYQIRPLGLLLRPALPPQWKLVSVTGDGNPEASQGEILWTGTIPSSPIKVTYRLEVPAGETGVRTIAEKLEWFASGQANPQESNAGADALLVGAQGSGFAQLNQVTRLDNGGLRLNLRAEDGRRYKIQKSADLSHWSVVTTVTAGGTGVEITDANTANSGLQFYRAVLAE